MGYERHDAIVVTSMFEEAVSKAHAEAGRLMANTSAYVSEITPVAVNGFTSFFVAPDGSKEGWADSDRAEEARAPFVRWLCDAGERGVWLDWVEVNFGGDDADHLRVRGEYDEEWRVAPEATDGEGEAVDG